MSMRLYKKAEIIKDAAKYGLKLIDTLDHHIIFQDKNDEAFSVPCTEEGCPDYLYDLFIAKINKSDPKVVGITKIYDVSEEKK